MFSNHEASHWNYEWQSAYKKQHADYETCTPAAEKKLRRTASKNAHDIANAPDLLTRAGTGSCPKAAAPVENSPAAHEFAKSPAAKAKAPLKAPFTENSLPVAKKGA